MGSVLRAVVIYIALWLLIRIAGRRMLAELNTFDFILLLIIGGATQRALTGEDYSLINAFVVISTLIVIDVLVGYIGLTSLLADKIIKGVPTILIDDGNLLTGRIRRARVTVDEIMERARVLHGLETLDQIKYAILEANGKISIIPREKPTPPPRSRKKSTKESAT